MVRYGNTIWWLWSCLETVVLVQIGLPPNREAKWRFHRSWHILTKQIFEWKKFYILVIIPAQLKHALQCCNPIYTRERFLHLGSCWLTAALFHVGKGVFSEKSAWEGFVHVYLFSGGRIKGNIGQIQGWQFSWKQVARRSAGMAVGVISVQAQLEQSDTTVTDHSASIKLAKWNFHKYSTTIGKY